MPRFTTSTTDAKEKYAKQHYDRIELLIPKGRKEYLRQWLDEHPEAFHGHPYDKHGSINRFVNVLIAESMGMSLPEWGLKSEAEEMDKG